MSYQLTTVTFEEEERQATLMALAELALSRPGFDYMLRHIANKLGGGGMYAEFKRLNADRVSPTIAAAPDLYEALEQISTALREDGDIDIAKARAALTKARGES